MPQQHQHRAQIPRRYLDVRRNLPERTRDRPIETNARGGDERRQRDMGRHEELDRPSRESHDEALQQDLAERRGREADEDEDR